MAAVYLRGSRFHGGRQSVAISYRAGYQISREPQVVANGAATASAPYGAWASDQGVAYATSGNALTLVASAPAVGQYTVAAGVYGFNVADNGQSILASYGYVPGDLAEAAMEWVAERFKYKDRIGMNSKSIGGQETVSFSRSAVPPFVDAMVQPYKRVVPC